jgi:hypothetical protein
MRIQCISEYKNILSEFKKSRNLNDLIFLKSIDKFKITKHSEGAYPAIISISGFLSEDEDNRMNWENSILELYPNNEWFHLEWNTQKLPFRKQKLSGQIEVYDPYRSDNTFISYSKFIKKVMLFVNPYVTFAHLILNNWWHLTLRNSKITGILLAQILHYCDIKSFILVGHSLGARVIHNCLEEITTRELNANIQEIHLLGGAVNSRNAKWEKASNSVRGRIFNYHSDKDSILKFFYSTIMIDRFPIGLKPVELSKFENIDVSSVILDHTEYISNFHKIKVK